MKKQVKAIEDNSSTQTENNFQIKSEPSYSAETKNEHPTLYSNNSYSNLGSIRFNNNTRSSNNYSRRDFRQVQSYNSNNGKNSSVSVNSDK